ncbi:MAG TPA: hypothetical protein VEQ59_02450, partial [Polyangiaceae bacterium]|nr:hypothetical protein [Polyangiaceae bacterium]
MRRGCAAVVLVCAVSAPAHAQSAPHEAPALSFTRLPGSERCPSAKDVAARVDLHLGRSAFVSPAAAQLLIDAAVFPAQPNGWQVQIALTGPAGTLLGTRQLAVESADCSAVTDAAALAIALMLDPDGVSHAARLDPEPSSASPAAALAPSPPPSAVRAQSATSAPAQSPAQAPRACPPAQQRERWRTRLSLGPTLLAGPLPG